MVHQTLSHTRAEPNHLTVQGLTIGVPALPFQDQFLAQNRTIMGFANLTQYLTPNLQLPLNGTVYEVPPPSKEDGLALAAFVAMGMNAAHNSETSAEDLATIAANRDRNLADMSLGTAHAQMLKDGVPGAHIDQAAIYAMYYWTMGEEQADAAFKVLYAMAAQGDLPKGLRLVRTGRNTASANPTKTESTPDTVSRPATSDHKKPSTRKAASRGAKPSPTGHSSSPTSPSTTA